MSRQTVERERAASSELTARDVDLSTHYTDTSAASTPKAMEQAAEVALLLALFPLTLAERAGFTLLLERRLRRA